jgi:hypothetical protein
MTTKTKLPALALAAAAVRKTICAAIAVLAVGGAVFAPLSASAGGRHGTSIHKNFATSPCQAGPHAPFPPGVVCRRF